MKKMIIFLLLLTSMLAISADKTKKEPQMPDAPSAINAWKCM